MGGHFSGNPEDFSRGTNASHIARYYISRGWVKPGETVVDAGCGTGYGSWMIAQFAKQVIAVDAEDTFDWPADNITFKQIHLGKGTVPECDTLISIECIEHINGLRHFIKEAQKKVGRLMFICAPVGGTSYAYTKKEQATPAGENNDFRDEDHIGEMFSNKDWEMFTGFRFGYSGIAVMKRKDV